MDSDRGGYELIDSGGQQKLERFGSRTVVRPCAQAVWKRRDAGAWRVVDATFRRDSSGTGSWQTHREGPETWTMRHGGLTWQLRPNRFGHLGIFPEQEPCWQWIRKHSPGAEILNLFAYTGGSTLSAAAAGAHVVHVDASKTSVRQARDNARLSGLEDRPVRWITDDAVRFVEREIRRERRYQGIVLDPPSYGRGTQGEMWQIDELLMPLLEKCGRLLAPDARFFLLTSHSPGYTPIVLRNVLEDLTPAEVEGGEMVISERTGRVLPSGAYARWAREVAEGNSP